MSSPPVAHDLLRAWQPRSLSVVVPVYDESANVEPLVRAILEASRSVGLPFEMILVDDGSSDDTPVTLRRLAAEIPELVVVRLRRNFGQTQALQAGLDRARGDAIVTMDGDLQNDPRDIPRLLERLCAGADVVSGWRRDRQDTLVLRRIPSVVANRLIRRVTRVPIHDQGCALKAYRADVAKRLDLYADMHRFIAIMTMPLGARIAEIEVRHHARVAGESKYGITRVFKVLADLATIQMLTRFREDPIRWFALLASPFLLASAAAFSLSLWTTRGSVVLPTIAVLTGLTFLQTVLFGLVGQAIVELGGPRRTPAAVTREWRRRA